MIIPLCFLVGKILDSRFNTLAETVTNYSLKLHDSDVLLIRGEKSFQEFYSLIEKSAARSGTRIIYDYVYPEQIRDMVIRSDPQEIDEYGNRLTEIASKSTAIATIAVSEKGAYLNGVEPQKVAEYLKKVNIPYLRSLGGSEHAIPKKWIALGYPLERHAKEANMSMKDYIDIFFAATLYDWERTKDYLKEIESVFSDAKQVIIYVPGQTELSFSNRGRGGDIGVGIRNLPDGEIYLSPVEDSVEGKILFPYTYCLDGNFFSHISLTFYKGEVFDYKSRDNIDLLTEVLNLNGAGRVGEIGFGCNTHFSKFVSDPIFYEKIAGTIHLGLGNSSKNPLSKGGGLNNSDIHWDLMCDLRSTANAKGGEIHVNGIVVQKDGRWIF
jgi:aminopeptidase